MRPTCLWCGRAVRVPVTLTAVFSWRPLPAPQLCATCQAQFQPITGPHCPQCGRAQATAQRCYDCERWGDELINRAIYPYAGGVQAYLQQYKFQGDYRLRVLMQPVIRRALRACAYDVLVPIPVTPETWQTRGFNQVTGWLTDQPFYQVLTVTQATKPVAQSQKTRQERLRTRQPFSLVPHAADRLRGQRVLLLDDVYTTGRTLRHAAHQIYFAGAKAVTSLTLAR